MPRTKRHARRDQREFMACSIISPENNEHGSNRWVLVFLTNTRLHYSDSNLRRHLTASQHQRPLQNNSVLQWQSWSCLRNKSTPKPRLTSSPAPYQFCHPRPRYAPGPWNSDRNRRRDVLCRHHLSGAVPIPIRPLLESAAKDYNSDRKTLKVFRANVRKMAL